MRICPHQSVNPLLVYCNHQNKRTHSVHQRGVLPPPFFLLLQALFLLISDSWPWDAALLSLDVRVYLLYLCLCTDFTGCVCIYTSELHLESISSKRFFFKRPLTAVDLFWLYSVPLLPWTSYCTCLSVELFPFFSLCFENAVYAVECCYVHMCVSLCINVWDLSLHNPTFFLVSMMHQQSATPHYTSAQVGGQHYQGQQAMGMMGQGSQGNTMISQRPMGSYRSSQQGRW